MPNCFSASFEYGVSECFPNFGFIAPQLIFAELQLHKLDIAPFCNLTATGGALVEEVLDTELPETYDTEAFKAKCQSVFDTVLDYAIRGYKFAA